MIIRAITKDDFSQWVLLWNANNLGQVNKRVTAMTWARLFDDGADVHGMVADIDGRLVGLLHYILHPTTGFIDPVCYMQDVFVDEDYRRQGIAKGLVNELADLARKENWARIYWLAKNDNAAAQGLYKNLGHTIDFSVHIMPTE